MLPARTGLGAGMSPGFPTVIPRMVVSDVVAAVAFLRTVFGAAGEVEAGRPAELRIGGSPVMAARAWRSTLRGWTIAASTCTGSSGR